MTALTALIALLLDRRFGYPSFLQARIGHPVQWMGGLIDSLEAGLNWVGQPPVRARLMGAAMLAILLAAVLVPAVLIALALRTLPLGFVLEAVLAAPFLAQKSLDDGVRAVFDALGTSLADARSAVGHIVGRDTQVLDEAGVSRAAIESLAENASDGVVAPLFFLLIFGLPGIVAYKAANTADSMVGHRTARFAHFGWASARLDDVLNWIPARITALGLAAAALAMPDADPRAALGAAVRDAPRHASPNAGWPEAAMAGALGYALGGPRDYAGETLDLAPMGDGRRDLGRGDIARALILYRLAMALVTLGVAVAAFAAVAAGLPRA